MGGNASGLRVVNGSLGIVLEVFRPPLNHIAGGKKHLVEQEDDGD